MSGTLITHCGAYKTDVQEVLAVRAPRPTQTWFPISHKVFLNSVYSGMEVRGYRIKREQYALAAGGNRMFGVIDVLDTSNKLETGTDGLSIGVRNSTDKSMSAGISFGQRVFVCDNLAFAGSVTYRTRHTRNIEPRMRAMIGESLGQAGGWLERQRQMLDEAKVKWPRAFGRKPDYEEAWEWLYPNEISSSVPAVKGLVDGRVRDIVARCIEMDVIPGGKYRDVVQRFWYGNREYPDELLSDPHDPRQVSAYDLYQSLTYAITRMNSAECIERRTLNLNRLYFRMYGMDEIIPDQEKEVEIGA